VPGHRPNIIRRRRGRRAPVDEIYILKRAALHKAAHQVRDRRARLRSRRAIEIVDDDPAGLRDCTIVEMNDAPRRRVEYLIIVVLDAPEEIGAKLSGHAEILF
jgi:hypothetical protein